MALGTYTDLYTALWSWMDASDVPQALMADVITVAEARIFREARTRFQETSLSTAIVSGVVAIPSNYVALKSSYINTSPVQFLERKNPEFIYTSYPQRSADRAPKYIAREKNSFIFGPYPDSGYTVNAVYYKKLNALSGANPHTLFTSNPDLYLFGGLAESEILIGRDKRIPLWEQKYKNILMDVNGQDQAEGASGSTIRMR